MTTLQAVSAVVAYILAAVTGAVPAHTAPHVAPHVASTPAVVAVRTFRFRPDTIAVRAGVAVTWANDDDIEHTITADSGSIPPHVDVALATKGAKYTHTFTTPGDFAYHCDRHPFMRGVVHVLSTGDHR